MEDVVTIQGGDDSDIFAVFDGHNGQDAAVIADSQLPLIGREFFEKEDYNGLFNTLHAKVIEKTESGTTATIAYVTKERITVLQCGDSAAFVLENRKLRKITKDHNTSSIEEAANIKKNGGTLEFIGGMTRVNGKICVTRSLGDRSLHPPLSCTPDIIQVDPSKVSYLVIMSDGIASVLQFVVTHRIC